MVRVIVWKSGNPNSQEWFHGEAGHAAIEIRGKYFSFWPSDQKRWRSIFDGTPAVFYSYRQDMEKRQFEPDKIIELSNLHEKSMLEFWKSVKNKNLNYHLLDFNCCITVILSLRLGVVNSRRGQSLLNSQTIHSFDLMDSIMGGPKSAMRSLMKLTSPDEKGKIGGSIPTLTPRVAIYFAKAIQELVG